MAMTFTIASTAREALSRVIIDRKRKEKEEDDRRAREYEEVSDQVTYIGSSLMLCCRWKLHGQRERR